MNTLFEMSISGAIIALVIIIIRKIIQNKVSKRLVYGLWAILLIHLLMPVRLSSDLSIFNLIALPIQLESILNTTDDIATIPINNTIPANSDQTNSVVSEPIESAPSNRLNNLASYNQQDIIEQDALNVDGDTTLIIHKEVTPTSTIEPISTIITKLTIYQICCYIWFSVTILLGIILLIIQFRLSRKINEATIYNDYSKIIEATRKRIHLKRAIKIYVSSHINTPLVYGFIKPRIVLPTRFINNCNTNELEHILTHEMVHIKRLDHILKPISLLLLVFHWFNPILWISFMLVQKDMEMSCDERVINAFDEDIRQDYATNLVNLAKDQNHIANTVTLAFGENNIKSRVKGIMTSNNKVKWITVAMVILLVPLSIILLTGRTNNEASQNLKNTQNNEIIDTTDSINELPNSESTPSTVTSYDILSIDEERFDEAVTNIVKETILGESRENIISDNLEDYQFIMDSPFKNVNLLIERLDAVIAFVESNHTVLVEQIREKQAIEWLISDILKNQAESPENIRSEDSYTIITSDICYGRFSPTEDGNVWIKLPKDTVLHITGFYDMNWTLATAIVPYSLDSNEHNNAYMHTDQVEFWINANNFQRSVTSYNDIWSPFDSSEIVYAHVRDFSHTVNDEMAAIYDSSVNEAHKYLSLRLLPDVNSGIIGSVDVNDLISIKKDTVNQEIRQNGWVLIGQFDQKYNSSTIGWVEEKYIEPFTEDSTPNQGFILRGTKAYEHLNRNSGPKFKESYATFLRYAGMQPIQILERQDGWVQFVDYGYTVSGWLREEDVVYQMTSEVEMALYNPKPQLDLFANVLQSEILNNPNFTLVAKDIETTKILTDEERTLLADSLTFIDNPVLFDGGITPSREAAYPYYSLEFEDYRLIITYDNQLLLLMSDDTLYDFGIGSESIPIRWVTPNDEFLQTARELLQVSSSNDPNDYNYLFNATNIKILNMDGAETVTSDEVPHINKCLRAVRNAMGDEIIIENPDEGITNRYEFVYTFIDGSQLSVTHTNQYIYFTGKYYKSLEDPYSLQANLVAGYF